MVIKLLVKNNRNRLFFEMTDTHIPSNVLVIQSSLT